MPNSAAPSRPLVRRPTSPLRRRQLFLEQLEDRRMLATLADHLAAIDGSTVLAKGLGTRVANAAELTDYDLPVVSESLSEIVSTSLSTQFQSLFTAVKNAIDAHPADDAAQLAAIDAINVNASTVTVVNNNATELSFKYQTSLATAITVAAAQDATDFGFGPGKYLEAAVLSALADGSLDLDATVVITFGSVVEAGVPVFYLGGGSLLNDAHLSQSVTLGNGSTVELIGSDLTVSITGDASFDVDFDVYIGTAGDKFTTANLPTIESSVSVDASGNVTLDGQLTATLLGVPFIKWDATMAFAMNDTGFSIPSVGSGIAISDAQFINKRDLVNSLIGVNGESGLLSGDMFGFNNLKLGSFDLNTVGEVAQKFKPVLDALSLLYGQGFSLDYFSNVASGSGGIAGDADAAADGVDDSDANETDGSGFDFDPSALISFVSGNTDVTLVSYKTAGDGPEYTTDIGPITFATISIYGIYYITFSAQFTFGMFSDYSFKAGLNGKRGAFIDQAETFVRGQIGAGAQINVDGKLFNLDELTTDSGRAGITGTASMKLKLDDPDNDGQIFLSDLGQNLNPSDPLGSLGDFLKDDIYFEKSTQGAFVLNYQHNTPESLFTDIFIPDELKGPLGDFIADTGLGNVISGAEDLLGSVGGAVGSVVDTWMGNQDEEAEDVGRALTSGDMIEILDEIARKLRPNIPEHEGSDTPPSSVLDLFVHRDDFDGIYHRLGVLIPDKADKASYTYLYDLDQSVERINPSDLESKSSTSSTDRPQDYLRYTLSADGKTLTVTPNLSYAGAAGFENTVRLVDIGGGKVRLYRQTKRADGKLKNDPIRDFTIVDGFKVVINTLGGDDTVLVDDSLTFRVEVDAGIGDDYVDAGGGDDYVYGDDGEDTIYGGPGSDTIDVGNDNARNYVYGEAGSDTLLGGPGRDQLYGGSGTDTLSGFGGDDRLSGGSEGDVLNGGSGNDYLLGGAGVDTLNGGGDDDTLDGGTGNDTVFGNDGNDFLYWKFGNGADTADGGSGIDSFQFDGNSANNTVDYFKSGSEVVFDPISNPSDGQTRFTEIEQVAFIAKAGSDNVTFGDLTGSPLIIEAVNPGWNDGTVDHVTFNGSSAADLIGVVYSPHDPLLNVDSLVGVSLRPDLLGLVSLFETDKDKVSVKGNNGADKIGVVSFNGTLNVDGGEGDDIVTLGSLPDNDVNGNTTLIQGTVNVDGSNGNSNRLIVSDIAGTANPNVVITNNKITGVAPAEINYVATGGHFINGATNDGILLRGSNSGADTFTVLSTLGGSTTKIEGNGGSDLFNVGSTDMANNGNLEAIQGLLTILAGAGANDRIYINDRGKTGIANYLVNATQVADLPHGRLDPLDEAPLRPAFAGIVYDGTAENLRLDGTDDRNVFDVTPSVDTELFIDGNLPNGDICPPINGDFLKVNFQGTRGRKLSFTDRENGNGKWQFNGQEGVGVRKPIQFESIEYFNYFAIVAVGTDVGTTSQPTVTVFDAETGETQLPTAIMAYEPTYRQGVRVAVGDVSGDGIPDIVTAPGKSHAQEMRVFDVISFAELLPFRTLAYGAERNDDGTNLALADLDDDRLVDIITVPSRGTAEVKVFKANVCAPDPIIDAPIRRFFAFPTSFIGGTSVATANLLGDGTAEIIVGSGSGMRATVNAFDVKTFGAGTLTPAPARVFTPFEASFLGGVWVAAGDVNGDGKADIIAGAGQNGGGRVETLDGTVAGRSIIPAGTFTAYTDQGLHADVWVVAVDTTFDQRVEIFTGQGQDGRSGIVKRKNPLEATAVNFLVNGSPESAAAEGRLLGFNPITGQWTGSDLFTGEAKVLATWATALSAGWQNGVTGDFDGDGVTDVAARNRNGAWQVGASQAGGFATSIWGGFDGTLVWQTIQVGDVNADGKADVVGYLPGLGQWWVAISTGSAFTNHLLAVFSTGVTWSDLLVADFTGDGRSDVAGRTNYGEWWIGESSASVGTVARLDKLTTWSTSVTWKDVKAADMNGDGKTDIVGRAIFPGSDGSEWWLAQTRLNAPNDYVGDLSALAMWYEPAGWNVVIADTNGDGSDEILGRTNFGEWWQASKQLGKSTVKLGQWESVAWRSTLVGDVDGDGREDLVGRKSNGEWTVSRFPAGPGSQVNSTPATWSSTVDWLFSDLGEDDDLLFPNN
jgi:hypothetical protein